MALLLVVALSVVECGVVTVAFLHDGSLNSGGEEAARLLVEEDAPSVLPSGITLQIIEAGSAKCDKDEAVGQLTSLLIANQANPPVAVMGNGCSNSLAATASLAQFYKFPQVTHAGSSTSMDSHTDYPYFLRTCAGDVTLLEVTVALLGAYKIGKPRKPGVIVRDTIHSQFRHHPPDAVL
jgi:ABC-type branched-subunit amino acid transport system substrate-binding protein